MMVFILCTMFIKFSNGDVKKADVEGRVLKDLGSHYEADFSEGVKRFDVSSDEHVTIVTIDKRECLKETP